MVVDQRWHRIAWQANNVGNLVSIDGVLNKMKYLKTLEESLKDNANKYSEPQKH